MFAMRRRDQLQEANITHVVSVLGGALDAKLFADFQHLQIEVDDDEDENLLEHFATTNEFIDKAVQAGGSVLIHCAMGKSRSATIATAYLIYKKQIPPDIALGIIKETRPFVEPNTGFWEQLQLYSDNLEAAIQSLDDVPAYQRYLYRKEVEMSRLARKAPTINHYMEDEAQESVTELKCKRCRYVKISNKLNKIVTKANGSLLTVAHSLYRNHSSNIPPNHLSQQPQEEFSLRPLLHKAPASANITLSTRLCGCGPSSKRAS